MGRPLWGTSYGFGDDQVRGGLLHFAIQKLLGKRPGCTLYVTVPDNYLTVVEKLWAQISNHMRACVAIGEGIETIRGIAVSEPILSEGASWVMRGGYGFNLPDTLTEVLGGFGINPGDRAELLVSAFSHGLVIKRSWGDPFLEDSSLRGTILLLVFSVNFYVNVARRAVTLSPRNYSTNVSAGF
ncbi:hypothetical protein BJV78DRAFT_1262671 [Lactifluus subvellereus]|nr:hypothetical protein BJV78DRAFT_1262671 [Lactifluus subvellereus]